MQILLKSHNINFTSLVTIMFEVKKLDMTLLLNDFHKYLMDLIKITVSSDAIYQHILRL